MDLKPPTNETLLVESVIHTCKNCDNTFEGKFCNRCGEKVIDKHERSMLHFLEGIFHVITHADSKIFKNLRLILTKPGFISKKYAEGIRQPFMKPIPMFFVANLIYFLFPIFETFNTSYHSQVALQSYSHSIKGIVIQKMKDQNITEKELAEKYNIKTAPLSKLLLILFVPAIAVVFAILNFKRSRFFADHLLMGLEFMIYTLFYNTILLGFILKGMRLIASSLDLNLGPILEEEWTFTLPVVILSTAYFLIKAERRFYEQKWIWAVVKSMMFIIAVAYIMTGYRLLLFFATIKNI